MNKRRSLFYLPMLFVLFVMLISITSTIQSAEEANSMVYMPLVSKPVARFWFQIYGDDWRVKNAVAAPDHGILLVGNRTLLRLNSQGTVIWYKETDLSHLSAVQPISDGGFVIAGGKNGQAIVMKLSDAGSIIWQKAYYGDDGEGAYDISPTTDGGYIVVGASTSFGPGYSSAWVFKLNEVGEISWQTTLGGTSAISLAGADLVRQTPDNGYIISADPAESAQGFLFKLNSAGVLEWQRLYDGSPLFWGANINDILPLANGDYLVAGRRRGDNHWDAWVAYLNSNGHIVWQKGYGYPGYFTDITASPDGHFVLSGYFNTNTWLHKMDINGTTIWNKRYGDVNAGSALENILVHTDGTLIAVGYICVPSSQCSTGVLWLNSEGTIEDCPWVTDLSVTLDGMTSTVQAGGQTVGTSQAITAAANITIQDLPHPQSVLHCSSDQLDACQP